VKQTPAVKAELHLARNLWGDLSRGSTAQLRNLVKNKFSVSTGDLALIERRWYVTHTGLLRFENRHHCFGIHVRAVEKFCDPVSRRWAFEATVYKSLQCRGFVGYGDADPSNVSPLVRGAEMRVAETRAVNRALRKAYGIGICSVEEIGGFDRRQQPPERPVRKLPPESVNGSNGQGGNRNGTRLRDRLCQIIRQHKLDGQLVKAYAVDFCGTKILREASREQVESFVTHLADWAAKDRNALLCQLNSYQPRQDPAAGPQQQAGAA
jgi:hypothetical protein